MKSSIEQSIKAKLKTLVKERESVFSELWRNLILERFLIRLAQSPYKEKFILKGGVLLAKYIQIGRETQDLDFFIRQLSNTKQSLRTILQTICIIDGKDSFSFEVTRIKILDHSHLAYRGAEVTLQALFGATKTILHMDLGFGDCVEPIEYPIDLTTTSKGPLFESKILLYCYPKEFIFAEKLETLVFRGEVNTRMKDFHDLYLLTQPDVLDPSLAKKALYLVFNHRKTPLSKLPISFGKEALQKLEKIWIAYRKKLKPKKGVLPLFESIESVITTVNQWLETKSIL